MAKLLGAVLLALLATLAAALPVQVLAPEQARRDYHEVAPIRAAGHLHLSLPGLSTPAPAPASTHYASTQYASQSAPSYTSDWQSQMLQQLNAIRASVGRPPVSIDQRLNAMAQEHSNYQASAATMTHSDPSGSLGSRCSQYGIDWQGVAENVAWNYKDVTSVVEGWKESPGHYANMIGDYNVVGFGVTDLYWTQDFAKV
ncbi:hypothetical protein H4R18_004320 [Coemansia javaensis]|uniref:SCP domain-containing protein n=1 Tax=Coemansia javaensis TaxID=2761396 RepID=A0A9W8LFY4_9FUNG|nr:hypothetical protein H4R18_004320 [Coemansia javaensis]